MARTKKRRKKGSGRVLAAGRTWAIRVTEEGERKYKGGYTTKDQAEQALADITRKIAAGLPGLPKKAEEAPLFQELADPADLLDPDKDEKISFFKARSENANIADDVNRWKRHLAPHLSDERIDAIDPAFIAGLVLKLKKNEIPKQPGRAAKQREENATPPKAPEEAKPPKPLSGGSIERVLHLLSAFYKWAMRMNHAKTNPVSDYLKSLDHRERRRIKSQHDSKDTPYVERKKDVARIFRALPEPVNIAYALSALAGLRPGECFALRWDDVDLAAGRLTVRRQVRQGKEGPPKSGKPRGIDLVPSLVDVLRAWREKTSGVLVVTPPKGSDYLQPQIVNDALEAALESLELPRLTFYCAGRHTFASQWVIEGLDLPRLSEIMGHASITTTMRYAHLSKTTPAKILARANVAL